MSFFKEGTVTAHCGMCHRNAKKLVALQNHEKEDVHDDLSEAKRLHDGD